VKKDGERLLFLDAVRGLAVLGILTVNAALFSAPMYQAWYPQYWPIAPSTLATSVWAAIQILFAGKFISLFSMLFGISVYLVGGEWGEPATSRRLRRRLLFLAAVGLVHGLAIWWGDILLIYALAGAIMIPLRSARAAALIAGGLVLYLLVWLFDLANLIAPAPEAVWSHVLPHQAGYLEGFWASLVANARDFSLMADDLLWNVLESLGLMLIGLGLFKTGVLRGESSARLYRLMAAAAALGLVVQTVFVLHEAQDGFSAIAGDWTAAVGHATAPIIGLGYAALMALAVPHVRRLPGWLAPVGRMALTNYLTQSLIMTALFYGGRGPGLFGTVDRPGLLLITLAVWALQIAWSHAWLARFEMGPAEWVWRAVTWGQAPPFRRRRT